MDNIYVLLNSFEHLKSFTWYTSNKMYNNAYMIKWFHDIIPLREVRADNS